MMGSQFPKLDSNFIRFSLTLTRQPVLSGRPCIRQLFLRCATRLFVQESYGLNGFLKKEAFASLRGAPVDSQPLKLRVSSDFHERAVIAQLEDSAIYSFPK